uniref:SH3 domain-containing protein n=1 Tax=Strigamia maritima TaxID=126957 RepID=T1JBE3_STRMM
MAREFGVRDAASKACNEPLKTQHTFTFHVVKTDNYCTVLFRLFAVSLGSARLGSARLGSARVGSGLQPVAIAVTFISSGYGYNKARIREKINIADFAQQLATIHEQQAEELQRLVETFRKRNAELRRDKPLYQNNLFASWETFLQEVEIDSQIHSDIASTLGRQVSIPLLERTFHRKVQSRKVFSHRENYEAILNKTEELLNKCYRDYSEAVQKLLTDQSSGNVAAYYSSHNAYVQQLHASNAMIDEYHCHILPQLLNELEDIYLDLSATVTKSITNCADIIAAKAHEQTERYENLGLLTKNVVARADLSNYIKSLGVEKAPPDYCHHDFTPPHFEPDSVNIQDSEIIPSFSNEVLIDKTNMATSRSLYDALRKEMTELHVTLRQLQDSLDTTLRIQQRSVESNLFNKANELQEDISLKQFDFRVKQIHLAAVRAQVELLGAKLDDRSDASDGRDRKMSSSSTGSMKSKWLKAFKSLKTGGGDASGSKKNDRKESRADGSPISPGENMHLFVEYTFKKIAACDVCNEILRGHTRQGMRCKLCKYNSHVDCQAGAGKCNPKSRFLRRQKSASEIETARASIAVPPEEQKAERVDPVYQLLKQAGDLSGKRGPNPADSLNSLSHKRSSTRAPSTSLTVTPHVPPSSISAPHSPQRQKLNLRMKSLSLDSPESNDYVQRVRRSQQPSSLGTPQSPVHSRRLLAAKTLRMNSVDLPDENEKSFSSASTSPCPSPKPHRILPTNLYVVLYHFRARQSDELDLKAGETITVTDTSDPDWWKGKGFRRGGFFPSKYVAKLNSGERPLQVTHNLQVSDGDNGLKLLRDQIVIQMGEEHDGMVLVRSGDRQGFCPLRYLQE